MAKDTVNNNPNGTDGKKRNIFARFVPRDAHGQILKLRFARRIILTFMLCLFVVCLVIAGNFVYKTIINPAAAFLGETLEPTPLPTPSPTPVATGSAPVTPQPTPTPEPTPDPYDEAVKIAGSELDSLKKEGIVNVLLVGVDYADEREDWRKYYYADVMIVLAINFNENKVDMISVPRDTYAKIANTEGIYKLNSSIYHGGGIPKGFPNVCESVSWVLGGIPIDYYIGVTMPVVKNLVDYIGGVDYDVDLDIKIQGRVLKPGFQHLNGQQVLDYLRWRKDDREFHSDTFRLDRQKRLLIAVFEKLKATQTIFDVPNIFNVFKNEVHTNLSFEKLTALAVFGYRLEQEQIKMHTLGGTYLSVFNWSFLIMDQDKRVKLIKEVYGVNAPKMHRYALPYVKWQWAVMRGQHYIDLVTKVVQKDDARPQPERKLLPEQRIQLSTDIMTLQQAIDAQADVEDKEKDFTAIDAAVSQLYNDARGIFAAVGIKVSSEEWFVDENPGKPRLTG